MIILNGGMTVDGKEIYFEDLMIESENEVDVPFDFLSDDEDDYCDGDCDECDCFDDDDEEEEDDELFNFTDSLDMLLDDYTELFMESCLCPECTKDLLLEFLGEFVDL